MSCNKLCNSINSGSDIVINGLCENQQDVSRIISEFNYWKQDNIQQIITIPNISPNIEEISSVNIAANILDIKGVKTPRSLEVSNNTISVANLEGKIITGRKIVIHGQLCEMIQYTTSDLYDSLRSITIYKQFSSYIIIPKEININGETIDTISIDFDINVCIEHLNINILDCRSILANTTILFYAIPSV